MGSFRSNLRFLFLHVRVTMEGCIWTTGRIGSAGRAGWLEEEVGRAGISLEEQVGRAGIRLEEPEGQKGNFRVKRQPTAGRRGLDWRKKEEKRRKT